MTDHIITDDGQGVEDKPFYSQYMAHEGNIGSLVHSENTESSQNNTSSNNFTTSKTGIEDNSLLQARHEPYSDIVPKQDCCGGITVK